MADSVFTMEIEVQRYSTADRELALNTTNLGSIQYLYCSLSLARRDTCMQS